MDPEKHQQAMGVAEHMRERCNEQTAIIGLAFIRAASAFTTLSRYEAAIERSYYRALHELQRLQQTRRGGHVPPPLAVDVTVSPADGGPDGLSRAPGRSGMAEPKHTAPAEEIIDSIEDELFN